MAEGCGLHDEEKFLGACAQEWNMASGLCLLDQSSLGDWARKNEVAQLVSLMLWSVHKM